MKEWREYMSESDGAWLILKNRNDAETQEDRLSIGGQDAVMLKRCEPSEHVAVHILPAARVTDDVKKTLCHEKEFYIQLSCMRDHWSVISKDRYSSDEVINIAKRFTGLTKTQAIKVWNMRRLGPEGNRIDL